MRQRRRIFQWRRQIQGLRKVRAQSEHHVWDSGLGLWRAKCGNSTQHPLTQKWRRSPHELFTPLCSNCSGSDFGLSWVSSVRQQWASDRRQKLKATPGAATSDPGDGANDLQMKAVPEETELCSGQQDVRVGDFLQEALPNVRLNVPKPEPGTEWLVVLTASSLAPWTGQSMKTLNHWIPAFRAARADKEIWMRRASEEVEKHVAQAHAEAAAKGSDPEQILQGERKTGNYIRFVKRLLAREILCFDIPGFGDCGCHALFAFMQDSPDVAFLAAELPGMEPQLRQIREELATAWRSIASVPIWHELAGIFLAEAVAEYTASKQPAAVETPPRKRPKRELEMSPAKHSGKTVLCGQLVRPDSVVMRSAEGQGPLRAGGEKNGAQGGKKQTGKRKEPVPPTEEECWAQVVSAHGLSYRRYVQYHAKYKLIRRDRIRCACTDFAGLRRRLAASDWPADCEACVDLLQFAGWTKGSREAPADDGAVVPASTDDANAEPGKREYARQHGLESRVTCCGRNRAKIKQHVQGATHMALSALQQPQRSVPALTDAVVSPPVECMGLVLGSELGKRSRLRSNLLPVWQEYAEFAFLGNRLTVNGTSTHVVQRLCTTGDWHFRHVSCTGKAAEPIRAKDGSQACSLCFGLGNDKNFLHRIARFVRFLDMARLLHAKIYAKDTVDTLLDSMTQKAVFKERNAKDYQQFFDMETRQLQQEVRQIFHGSAQQRTTSAMHYFCAHVVFPCLQVHPDHVLQGVSLDTFYRCIGDLSVKM
ncbi:unnamed protein product [Symbiodinium microadriaticum]|nr:unnamed protein product [Symbiodinium microadriaticum]